jgi:hypothetical protein
LVPAMLASAHTPPPPVAVLSANKFL